MTCLTHFHNLGRIDHPAGKGDKALAGWELQNIDAAAFEKQADHADNLDARYDTVRNKMLTLFAELNYICVDMFFMTACRQTGEAKAPCTMYDFIS